jgi:type II secretory ATPase GspE/PulE/Tfp pilus assembly ATPase PilB-like protein
VIGFWLALEAPAPLCAQAENAQASASAPTAISPAAPRASEAYPPNPFGFFRGHGPPDLLENPRAIGLYFDSFLMLAVVIVFLLWVRTSYWVSRDSASLRLSSTTWNLAMLIAGSAGFLLVFFLPRYYNLLPLFALYGLPLYAYVRHRNSRVPEFSKVMTPRHFVAVVLRQLAKVGIRVQMPGFQAAGLAGTSIRFLGKSDDRTLGVSETISRQAENSPNYLAAKDLILRALTGRASDIHLEPKEGELAVRLRIDGLMVPDESYEVARGRNIINIFKILCALDITERRRAQDGSFRAEALGREIDFRVATQSTQLGEKLSIRVLDPENSVSELDELGLRKGVYDQLRETIRKPHGLMLAVGPAGSGKSTTLHAALNDLDTKGKNVITIEDPVEYRLDSVTQIEIKTSEGQTFFETLRNVLRQDPDVVMIGEIRDGETASAACQAALAGHMVLSTLHASDTIAALLMMLELGTEPSLLTGSLEMILAERLVRRLCTECKQEYKPTKDDLAKLGLPPDDLRTLYREGKDPKCPQCRGRGYVGQVGVFEMLLVTDELRKVILDNPTPTSLRLAARNQGLLTLREEGLRLVARGITSIEELTRVVG